MIVKIPEQRQYPDGSNKQQSFDDLVKYLLEKFGLEETIEFLRTRHATGSNHESVMTGFTDILSYATGDLSPAAHSPVATSPTGPAPTVVHDTDSRTTVTSPDKCLAVEVHGVAHLTTAIAEMNAVAARNPRVKDAAYHFILSWPEHEKPEYAKIFDAARHALRALNLHEHQYMLAIHGNTDNVHCHVAVNRVHPLTYKSQHLPYAMRTLHHAARESEIKHGWSHDNGIYIVEIGENGEKRIVKNTDIDVHSKADPYGVAHSTTDSLAKEISPAPRSQTTHSPTVSPWTDPDSLVNWARTIIASRLKTALPTFTSWQDLHQFLSDYHVSLTDTGGGGMRLTAVEAHTGEILNIPVSKALRILKRPDLEARWGAYQSPVAPSQDVQLRRMNNAEDIANFDQFDQFGPHPEIAARRERLRELLSEHVDGDQDRSTLLLPRDAPDHMEHTEADFDTRVRRGSDGRRRIVPSPDNDSPNAPLWNVATVVDRHKTAALPNDPYTVDPFQFGKFQTDKRPKRDPHVRALRKEERTAARIALRRRYQQYREVIAKTNAAHDVRKTALIAQQREERRQQRDTFFVARKSLQTSTNANRVTSAIDHSLTASLLAHNHTIAKLQLATHHRAQRTDQATTRLPALPWREWLCEQAQDGDRAALSALRGLVYQARRDANPIANHTVGHAPYATSTTDQLQISNVKTGASTTDDLDIATYLDFIAKLRDDEKRERAIRSANANQVRPYQCDALLVAASHMTYRVTGNGNVQYFDVRQALLFTDRGNRLTFDRETVTDDELRLALLHAREKFGDKLTLTGEDPIFTERMARMADDLGIGILNPELRSAIAAHRSAKQRALAPSQRPTPPKISFVSPRAQPVTSPEPTPPAITPELHTPQSPTTQPPTTQPPPSEAKTPEPSTLTTTTPQPQAPVPASPSTDTIPAVTPIERLRQTLLADHPRATFLTVNRQNKTPYIGTIVAVDTDTFVQRVGRNTYAFHIVTDRAELPTISKTTVQITYHDGRPVQTIAARKSRAR